MKNYSTEFFALLDNGDEINSYTLENDLGTKVTVIPFGATITSIQTADRNGEFADIVLGYDTLPEYQDGTGYFGAFVGRYANRINGAVFHLDGKTYKLEKNDGNNTLHGGLARYSHRIFNVSAQDDKLTFTLTSPDGDGGYPGKLDITLTYMLTDDNRLVLDYKAVSDAKSIINFTNHSYFNLNGHNSGDILDHELMIKADRVTENDEECVPTGNIFSVVNSPFDFRTAKAVGKDIDSDHPQLKAFDGYDNNFILKKESVSDTAAELYSKKSGRTLKVVTTKPGMQLYTGNKLDGCKGKNGAIYNKNGGLCLETGFFPGGPDMKDFPDVTISPEKPYHHITVFEFGVK